MASGADVPLVLVTGATGYIASHVIKLLLEEGYRVRGTVRNIEDEKKLKPLKELCPNATHPLEFAQTDLTKEDGWKEAVKGCTYVHHIASPLPLSRPTNEDEVLKPAIEGTSNVLRACSEVGGVKRVVLTSSSLAVHASNIMEIGKVYTEADWADVEPADMDPYAKSKVLAEKAAWDFVKELPEEKKFELAVINPGLVLGPIITSSTVGTVEVVKKLLDRSMPMVPRFNFHLCDVRDVAQAQLKAMLLPAAVDNRCLIVTQNIWMKDMALILSKELKPQGYSIPTITAPYFALWLSSLFDKSIRMVLPRVGVEHKFDNTRMKDVMGITPRDLDRTIIDTAYSLIEFGVVKKSKKCKLGRLDAAPPAEEKQVNGEVVEGAKEAEELKDQQQPEEPKMVELEPEDKEKPITEGSEQQPRAITAAEQ